MCSSDLQSFLATCYHLGRGTQANLNAAKELYEKAANHGNVAALLALGVFHLEGTTVPKNLNLSYQYFSQAAAKGNGRALYHLGKFTLYGRVVEKNEKKAIDFFLQSRSRGYNPSSTMLGHCYRKGLGFPKGNVLSSHHTFFFLLHLFLPLLQNLTNYCFVSFIMFSFAVDDVDVDQIW